MRRLVVLVVLLPWLVHAEVLSSAVCTPAVTTGCFTRNTAGFASVFVDISGTWTGTIVFESAGSSAGPWRTMRAYSSDGSGAYALSVTAGGSWSVPTWGAPVFRVRATSLTSGSATVSAHASAFGVPADVVRIAGDDFGEPSVTLTTPDGGLPVAVPDPVRVVGPTFGAVQVSGTIEANLSSSSIAALDPAFIYPDLPPAPTLTTTVTTLDDPTITNRSELTVRNIANGNLRLWCCRGAACTPTSTAAYILGAGESFKFDNIRDSDTIRCRAATDPVQVNYIEVAQ